MWFPIPSRNFNVFSLRAQMHRHTSPIANQTNTLCRGRQLNKWDLNLSDPLLNPPNSPPASIYQNNNQNVADVTTNVRSLPTHCYSLSDTSYYCFRTTLVGLCLVVQFSCYPRWRQQRLQLQSYSRKSTSSFRQESCLKNHSKLTCNHINL